jgi:hypothetical protein
LLSPILVVWLGICPIATQAGTLKGGIEESTGSSAGSYAPAPTGDDAFASPDQSQIGYIQASNYNNLTEAPEQTPESPSSATSEDQDSQMQLMWDLWHKRIGEEIFKRFNFFAKAAFKYSPPLVCRVTYTVTSTGDITNITMLNKSPDLMFNLLVLTVIKSLNGEQAILQFPPGSQRLSVTKTGTFLNNQNGTDGFSYTVGDKELVAH